MTNLSPNFTISEAMKSATAVRLGINNEPPADLAKSLINVATRILEPVRANWSRPIRPSSWYRCEQLEKAICWGGRADSAFVRWCVKHDSTVNDISWSMYLKKKSHPSGQAVDFEVTYVSNIDLARWCRDHLEFDQLILEFYDPDDPRAGWVHCSYAEGWNRNEVLTYGKTGTFAGLPE